MIKVVVAGVGGRMGGRIVQLIAESKELIVAGAFEKVDHPSINKDLGEWLGIGKTGQTIVADPGEAIDQGQVLIDFTFHTASLEHLRLAAARKIPAVIGSTGFTPQELEEIRELMPIHPLRPDPQYERGGECSIQGGSGCGPGPGRGF